MDKEIEVIAKVGLEREPGWVYFLSVEGDIVRRRPSTPSSPITAGPDVAPTGEVVVKLGINREPGWLYTLNYSGDVVRTRSSDHD